MKIICFVVQANHVHLLIRVTDPEMVSRFVGYFKAESANYLNRLLSRRQRTVWAARFDSPAVLDVEKAIEYFAYCSLNPVKDGLVHSMSEYPGVASYNYFMKEQNRIAAKDIPRSEVSSLIDPHRPQRENLKLSEYFSSDEFEDLSIQLSPDELRLAFASSKKTSPEEFRRRLLETLTSYEALYQEERPNEKPMGVAKLISGSLLSERKPPIKGGKSICLSTFKELRKEFIATFKKQQERCRSIFKRWRNGEIHVPYPPGMFAPHPPRIANFLPRAVA